MLIGSVTINFTLKILRYADRDHRLGGTVFMLTDILSDRAISPIPIQYLIDL